MVEGALMNFTKQLNQDSTYRPKKDSCDSQVISVLSIETCAPLPAV